MELYPEEKLFLALCMKTGVRARRDIVSVCAWYGNGAGRELFLLCRWGVELAEQICVFVQMGVELEEKVNKEVQEVIQYASGPWPSEMKSIRGLEERLYGLDKLVHSAETTVEAQVNTSKVCG